MKKKLKFLIIMIIILLFILLMVVLKLLSIYQNDGQIDTNSTDSIFAKIDTSTKKPSNENTKITIKQIIENSGSVYIREEKNEVEKEQNIYVEFKYNLFNEDGKDKKTFFYSIINQIENLKIGTFRIKDETKNIEIYAVYDDKKETYTVYINGMENFFDIVDGDIFNEVSDFERIDYSNMVIDNTLIKKIASNSSRYQNTELITDEKEELENGYYSFQDGKILARLQKGKALNIIFKPGYKEKFTLEGIYVGTPLSEIKEKYSRNSFGSVGEGYLGYYTQYGYIFFYENEVSVYPCIKKDTEYFDEYIINYCRGGSLKTLVSDFTEGWTTYFENESDLENKSCKISFPTRGIMIDIKDNDSRGITLYNNYSLSPEIKDLIITNKITLKENQNLVEITEKARRESM